MKSTLQGELVPEINRILKPHRIGRAYPELRCTFGGRSTVPDITVKKSKFLTNQRQFFPFQILPMAYNLQSKIYLRGY